MKETLLRELANVDDGEDADGFDGSAATTSQEQDALRARSFEAAIVAAAHASGSSGKKSKAGRRAPPAAPPSSAPRKSSTKAVPSASAKENSKGQAVPLASATKKGKGKRPKADPNELSGSAFTSQPEAVWEGANAWSTLWRVPEE